METEVVLKCGDKEMTYQLSDDVDFKIQKKDYVEGKISFRGETENGTRVLIENANCKVYEDGTIKGESHGFTITGNVKEG